MLEAHPVEAADYGHAKVSDLEGARAVAEDVVRLDVHHNYSMAVQERQPLQSSAHFMLHAMLDTSSKHLTDCARTQLPADSLMQLQCPV